jgi:hypothetical protein
LRKRAERCFIGDYFMNKARKKVAPAAKKRGADANVPPKSVGHRADEENRKLEQGLEESMAGSDPPSITQPVSDKRSQSDPTFAGRNIHNIRTGSVRLGR